MRTRTRRILAVLAGGLVLAGGSVTTLASWHDQVVVKAPVTLSTLSVLASVDDQNWNRADDLANPGSMSLAVSGALNALLTPGGATTAWVGLRADKGSAGAHIAMTLPTVGSDADSTALAPSVRYQVLTNTSRADCIAGSPTFAGVPIPLIGTGASSATLPAFDLPAGTSTAMGTPVGVCFKLALDDGLARSLGGKSISPVWRFDATSL